MKIRTDFVTNSSSSSFLVMTLKTKKGEYKDRVENWDVVGISSEDQCESLLKANNLLDFVKILCWNFDGLDEETTDWTKVLGEDYIPLPEALGENVYKGLSEIEDISDILEFTYMQDNSGWGEMEDSNGAGFNSKLNFVEKTYDFYSPYDDEDEYYDDEDEYYDDEDDDSGFMSSPKFQLEDLPVTFSITGTECEGRIERIEHVKVGDKLILKADYNNKLYYNVAIEVFNSDNQSLGYLQELYDVPLKSIANILNEIDAYVESVTPLSARRKNAKYALMDVKLVPKE